MGIFDKPESTGSSTARQKRKYRMWQGGQLVLDPESQRRRRRRLGLSGRQWRRQRRVHRSGQTASRAKALRLYAARQMDRVIITSVEVARKIRPGTRIRMLSRWFYEQRGWPMMGGVDWGKGDDQTVIVRQVIS